MTMKQFLKEWRYTIDKHIQARDPGPPLNDAVREDWVRNDEGLKRWAEAHGVLS
jgi:hypothetical protein